MIKIIILIILLLYYYSELRLSTINNPVGNPSITGTDLTKVAGSINKDNLRYNTYEDSNKPYIFKLLDRTFYQMPVTTYPNNTKKAREFIYQKNIGCKTDAQGCFSYRDERFLNRYLPKRN